MLRAPVAALVLVLSGCLAAGSPAPPEAEAGPQPDGAMVVTATRVEPLLHWVDVRERIESRPCPLGDEPCSWRLAGSQSPGLDYDVPVHDFGDPLALFWRVALRADSDPRAVGGTPVFGGLRMEVAATRPCGIDCVRERLVAQDETQGHAGFDSLDVYLEPGETGVRVRLVPLGSPQAYVGENRLDYRLHGAVGGFRAVADPVLL